jgi:hypothetical protein
MLSSRSGHKNPMAQRNDLSRSLISLEQDSTIIAVIAANSFESAARHGLSLDAGLRKHAEKLEQNSGGRHAGDAGGVERRRHLDEIGADEIEAPRSRIRRWASSVVRPVRHFNESL